MRRRTFLSTTAASLVGAALGPRRSPASGPGAAAGPRIGWHRPAASMLFDQVDVNGRSLLERAAGPGLLDATCECIDHGAVVGKTRLGCANPAGACGPLRVALAHTLHASGGDSREDLLEATLTLRNPSDRALEVRVRFRTGACPDGDPATGQVFLPLSAAALNDAPDDPQGRLKDCRQAVAEGPFLGHYLEPPASDARHNGTRAPLLAPVIDRCTENGTAHLALFGSSTLPAWFEVPRGPSSHGWQTGCRVQLPPGQSREIRTFLLVHAGGPENAWKAFHRFGHREDFPVPAWPRDVRVHYFDFLASVAPGGRRGGGYDADLPRFREFRVGMATQHGYYPAYGDFVHPDRREWMAMPRDAAGPVPMSLDVVKARVESTRRAGARPAIYLHFAILDEGSPLFEQLRDAVLVDASGQPARFGWEGPDVIRTTWRMSQAAPQWRDHLVQQAQWIMELFNPDALVLDETFTASGWDHHPNHGGPLSAGGIELMRRLRAVVRSFGPHKALFASDCSMASYCLWGDGEAGDHCYDRLLGHELYRKPPVRYLAALGAKPWLPCAWLGTSLWEAQMDLARKTGAAVGLTNGWGNNLGLTRLPEEMEAHVLRDIASLHDG